MILKFNAVVLLCLLLSVFGIYTFCQLFMNILKMTAFYFCHENKVLDVYFLFWCLASLESGKTGFKS